MIQVHVRRVSKDRKTVKTQTFLFKTSQEAVAFMSGLRVRDGWKKTEQLLDAVTEPDPKM